MARSALLARIAPAIPAVLTVLALAGCSSGSSPTPAKAEPVVGNGKHYTITGASVAQSQWPNPCSLLPKTSGAAAIGTQVTIKRFHASCFYVPRSAAFPNLAVTLQGVGTELTSRYAALRQANARRTPHSVSNVGRQAFIYSTSVQPTTTLVVLGAGAIFSVSLTTPQGASMPAARLRATLVAVAQPIAKEFSA